MTLMESGAVVATEDNQLIEGLRIHVESGPAINIDGFKNVLVRNCEITHSKGHGIKFKDADGLKLESIIIRHTGWPEKGKLEDLENGNIDGMSSSDVVVDRIRASGGSAGIYLYNSPNAQLSNLELKNFRGPFWKGQAIQLNSSPNCRIENFHIENERGKSWVEDNISIYHTSNCTVRNGVINGNDAPYGAAIQFEQRSGIDSGGLVEDVYAMGTMNAAFSTYPGFNVIFRRTYLKDNFCEDLGRGPPASGGLGWQGGGTANGAPADSLNTKIEQSVYFNLCNDNVTWGIWSSKDISSRDFTPPNEVRLSFPWE
jgi:hypothetical protein